MLRVEYWGTQNMQTMLKSLFLSIRLSFWSPDSGSSCTLVSFYLYADSLCPGDSPGFRVMPYTE